ncbi:hypothetical protein L211DRAFT_854362 [Terfezia boudieri ATCC MYA-4762]|uniref:Uncharacterized protein n=1 Tax=Terfezia boudieri ATCC MYA-4762 TaxID=1051890 RepID=A0A3N4L5J8_9PEZI|nr:hypothetical protein L211DRAFT_854362 [Terfezia boudieri ATCC MYA-4762]
MATQHTQSEVRKAISRGKLTTAWSIDWEDKLEDIMPPFPAEKFLQVLAKYAEENPDISSATKYFKGRIDLRMGTKKTKKNLHLILRDIADEAATEKSRQKGKKVQQIERSDDDKVGSALGGESSGAGGASGVASGVASGAAKASGGGEPKALTHTSRIAPPKESPLKRRRTEGGEKIKKFRLGFTAENLDIDERIEELKRAAVSEKEKDKALKIEHAANALFGSEEKKDTSLALEILQDLLKAMTVEPIVISDSE